MKKQRNILIGLLTGFSAIFVAVIILFAFKVIKLWAFLTFGLISLFAIVISVLILVKVIKKIKKMALEAKKKNAMETTGNYMLDIYNLLGIPPQYNKDGTLKNVYELLGIEPMYDEKGNRILTPYELLGFLPKFDQNGKEIPAFYVIKNRIGRIAKVGLSTAFLTRKLSKEEEEQKIIRETLEKQLKEAEAKKEDKKAALIKKVIANKKKDDKKKADKKKGGGGTVKFATGKYKPDYTPFKKEGSKSSSGGGSKSSSGGSSSNGNNAASNNGNKDNGKLTVVPRERNGETTTKITERKVPEKKPQKTDVGLGEVSIYATSKEEGIGGRNNDENMPVNKSQKKVVNQITNEIYVPGLLVPKDQPGSDL